MQLMTLDPAQVTDATLAALGQLRDITMMQWYIVPFVGFVLYVYAVEVERKRWDVIAAGFAFLLMDVFNELVNSAWLHASGTSALWTVTGPTAYQILVGWSIEIVLLFAISGIEFVKFLPDKAVRILGIPNRIWFVLQWSIVSVGVELILEAAGIFHWHWSYWGLGAGGLGLIPIVFLGYATFFAMAAIVFDQKTHKRRYTIVGIMLAIDAALALSLGMAGWL